LPSVHLSANQLSHSISNEETKQPLENLYG